MQDNGGRTALYSGKDEPHFLERSWNTTLGAVDQTGVNDGRDKIDAYRRSTPGVLTDALIAALRNAPPDLATIHYRGPHGVGHAQGFLSQAYLDEVSTTDRLIGRVLDAIAGSPSMAASTVVVVRATTAVSAPPTPMRPWLLGPGAVPGSRINPAQTLDVG